MSEKMYLDPMAEKEANEIGKKFMNSSDVVGDMSRAYGTDLSSVRIHTGEDAGNQTAQRGVDAFSTGSDVFFARGAFNPSDSASRGLLAHELAHSMQQGLGSGSGVQTAAPAGAAQGGLISFFRNLFGGNHQEETDEETTNEPITDTEINAVEDNARTVETPAAESGRDPQGELISIARELQSSKKAGGGPNSAMFDEVMASISEALGALTLSLSGDPRRDEGTLLGAISYFNHLIRACDTYLGREAKSGKGKIRQEIVKRVRQLAVDDRVGFVKYMKTPYEGKRFGSVLEVLTESRRRTLKLVDRNEKDLQHVGGAASYLAKIESGMLEGTNESGFFKAEERYYQLDAKDRMLYALEVAQKRKPVSAEIYNKVRSLIEREQAIKTDAPEYLTNREYHELIDRVIEVNASIDVAKNNLKNPLKSGESLNLSGRNVATSRLAELLGLGDLVAKSETAVLESSDGGKITGNLMQEAKGTAVLSYLIEQRHDQYREQTENLDTSGQKSADDVVTPEFLKSLISLQVLDNLAGQEDRHMGNYFAEVTDGKFGKVTAIDHDFSFGARSLTGQLEGRYSNRIGTHGKNILDENGKITLPYMDNALADRIVALDEQVVRDIMADVLEPWAIDALCMRLQEMKDAIIDDRNTNPLSGRYLRTTAAWGQQKVLDTLRNGYEETESGNQMPTNYVSIMLMSTETSNTKYAGQMDFSGLQKKDFKQRLTKDFLEKTKEMDPETVKNLLLGYGVSKKIVQYLWNTGQICDGPDLLKRVRETDLLTKLSSGLYTKFIEDAKKKKASALTN